MSERKRVYLFKGFERFWHWTQALLIIFMAATGFEIHGFYRIFGFEQAVNLHTTAAWALIGVWVFAIFWHLTTGEWRHYIPTRNQFMETITFYSIGIFKGARHPFTVSARNKHNPLQRVAYLLFKLVMAPLIWISGLLYLYYNWWDAWWPDVLPLAWVALAHTFAAFLLLTFLAGHLYLITTGDKVFSQLKAMITGWDEVEE